MAPDLAATITPGEDTGLMRRVQQGDEAAFGALMQRWERPLKAFVARLVLNRREAEEIAQETFVRVWQQRQKFRPQSEFRPWLFSIAVNLARNRLRWWRRRPTVSLEDWSEAAQPAAAGGKPTALTGHENLEEAERAVAVREAVAALPAELREAIVLFEYEGLSHGEIAVVLRCTRKAVEARIYRAREKLRKSLRRMLLA